MNTISYQYHILSSLESYSISIHSLRAMGARLSDSVTPVKYKPIILLTLLCGRMFGGPTRVTRFLDGTDTALLQDRNDP